MRIGIEVQRIFRNNKHGMEMVALEFIRQLQAIDRVNEYVIFVGEDVDQTCLTETGNFRIKQLKSKLYPVWEQIQLPSAASHENLDILHCTANTAPLFSKIPLVLTLHDVIYLEKIDFSGSNYQNLGNLYRRFVVPKITSKCEIIITVSEYEKQRIAEELPVSENKLRVIYNAVSDNFKIYDDPIIPDQIQRKYKLPNQFILFLGNTAQKKNTKCVIQSYAHYCDQITDNIPLVVLDFPKEKVCAILKETGHEQLIDQVYCPGYIDRNEMPYFYNLATIFLYPSLRESFGMPILEAMACGTPVITSNTSAMPEIAGEAAILVNPKNKEEIAYNINRLLSDSSLYFSLREKGILRKKDFSWSNTAKKILETYHEISS